MTDRSLMEDHIKKTHNRQYSTSERILAYTIVGAIIASPAIVFYLAGFEAGVITALVLIIYGVWYT